MTRSSAKKALQNFHARTRLWELFNRRADEMDCSVDYLINEAMRLYASSHGFLETTGSSPAPGQAAQPEQPAQPAQPTLPGKEPAPTIRAKPGAIPRPGGTPGPSKSTPGAIPRPGGVSQTTGSGAAPAPPRPSQPPPPRTASQVTGTGQSRPPLMLVFQGRKIPILQDQFIIGRGSKASDLAIKDANISRKHAAVIYHNGAYYLKDLGSTNGIEYNGKPVDSKRIDEGDVFAICGYDLHFTYTA